MWRGDPRRPQGAVVVDDAVTSHRESLMSYESLLLEACMLVDLDAGRIGGVVIACSGTLTNIVKSASYTGWE